MKRKQFTVDENVTELDMSETIQTCVAQTVIAVSLLRTLDPNDWYTSFMDIAELIIDAQKVLSAAREQQEVSLALIKFTVPLGMELQRVKMVELTKRVVDELPF